MPIEKLSVVVSYSCMNGHHNECEHYPKKLADRKDRFFIVISSDTYNNWSRCVLALSVTSKNNTSGFNLIEKLLFDDLKKCTHLAGSFVRCDCICRIERNYITDVVGTITPNAFERLKGKMNVFIDSMEKMSVQPRDFYPRTPPPYQ